MKENISLNNEALDHSEEYWIEYFIDDEDKPYFPLEESKPPHY